MEGYVFRILGIESDDNNEVTQIYCKTCRDAFGNNSNSTIISSLIGKQWEKFFRGKFKTFFFFVSISLLLTGSTLLYFYISFLQSFFFLRIKLCCPDISYVYRKYRRYILNDLYAVVKFYKKH